jgi:hypothetical protein
MSWFTENPWPLIVILGIVAAVCLAVWSSQKRGLWLGASIFAVIAAIGVYVLAQSVETEAERVAKEIDALTDAFTKKDQDRTLAFFSPKAVDLRLKCVAALAMVDFPNGIDIKDVSVEVKNQNSLAISFFRANGTVSVTPGGSGHIASRWKVTWQKEAGLWKIVDVRRWHPYKDEEMGMFEPRQN